MSSISKVPSKPAGTLPIKIELNGTGTNPYLQFGLTQNPFPQYPRYETQAAMLAMAKLGADPIPHDKHAEYIRRVLRGLWIEDVVELCIQEFVPGKVVKFNIYVKREFLLGS